MKKILILGGSGFIGSHLYKSFTKKYDVKVADICKNEKIKDKDFVKFDYFACKNFEKILKGYDIVINLICSTIPNDDITYIFDEVTYNLRPFLLFLKTCLKLKIKIIFASSGGTVYGNKDIFKIKEEATTSPISNYGIIKLMFEKYIFMFSQLGLNYIILRIANPYSSDFYKGRKQGIIPIFINKIKNNENVVVYGDGMNTRDFININDVVEAFNLIIFSDINNEIYNIGSGKGKSINQILSLIFKEFPKSKSKILYKTERFSDVRHNVLDINKFKQTFNWNPKHNVRFDIKEMCQK